MNIKRQIALYLFLTCIQLIPNPSLDAATMRIRAEGASRIGNVNAGNAFEIAQINALKKAFESQLNTLASLSIGERQEVIQELLDKPERYLVDIQTVKETVNERIARVVVEGELLSEQLVALLIDAGYLGRFKQKPRVVIAVKEQHRRYCPV